MKKTLFILLSFLIITSCKKNVDPYENYYKKKETKFTKIENITSMEVSKLITRCSAENNQTLITYTMTTDECNYFVGYFNSLTDETYSSSFVNYLVGGTHIYYNVNFYNNLTKILNIEFNNNYSQSSSTSIHNYITEESITFCSMDELNKYQKLANFKFELLNTLVNKLDTDKKVTDNNVEN